MQALREEQRLINFGADVERMNVEAALLIE
jgi:hypothetical protein